jgi:hypothetical protein
VDKTTHRIRRDYAQKPQDDQYDGNGIQH